MRLRCPWTAALPRCSPPPAAMRALRLGTAARPLCLAHPQGERTFARPRRRRQARAQLTAGRDEGTGDRDPLPAVSFPRLRVFPRSRASDSLLSRFQLSARTFPEGVYFIQIRRKITALRTSAATCDCKSSDLCNVPTDFWNP